jgi:hypothetical protein
LKLRLERGFLLRVQGPTLKEDYGIVASAAAEPAVGAADAGVAADAVAARWWMVCDRHASSVNRCPRAAAATTSDEAGEAGATRVTGELVPRSSDRP